MKRTNSGYHKHLFAMQEKAVVTPKKIKHELSVSLSPFAFQKKKKKNAD